MAEDTDRPQDPGRRHGRKGSPSPETRILVARYQAAMRGELGDVLDELAPAVQDAGLGLDGAPLIQRPPIKERAALWDLAIKLRRELGVEIDPGPSSTSPAPAARRSRRRPDFGGA